MPEPQAKAPHPGPRVQRRAPQPRLLAAQRRHPAAQHRHPELPPLTLELRHPIPTILRRRNRITHLPTAQLHRERELPEEPPHNRHHRHLTLSHRTTARTTARTAARHLPRASEEARHFCAGLWSFDSDAGTPAHWVSCHHAFMQPRAEESAARACVLYGPVVRRLERSGPDISRTARFAL
jgi:hypothetical protein